MPVEEEIRVEELSAFMEEACMDAVGDLTAEVERIEVLRLEEDQAVWIDVEEMDGSTCVEPFLLLRGWVQGVAVPAVMSMLTLQKEEIHDFQIADLVRDFSHTLGSNEHDWTSALAVPPSIEALHSAAQKLFRRAEIHVAALNVVTLVTKDTMMIFGDDLDLSERHKLLQGCELWPSAPNAFDPTYLGPKSVEFMVAVHDDLRVGAKKGVEAVLATFLSRRVHQLLESGERPESAALVQFLAQLYVRKALGPPEANLLDLANSEDLIRDLASAGIGPIRPDILKSGVATSRVFDPPPEGAPIYLITAAIAEAYETLLEKLWQRLANV